MSEPVMIHKWSKTLCFGLVRLDYAIEDRGSHLQASRYKNYLDVRVLGHGRVSWVFRTEHPLDDQPFLDTEQENPLYQDRSVDEGQEKG